MLGFIDRGLPPRQVYDLVGTRDAGEKVFRQLQTYRTAQFSSELPHAAGAAQQIASLFGHVFGCVVVIGEVIAHATAQV
jgi:hypothetical protein